MIFLHEGLDEKKRRQFLHGKDGIFRRVPKCDYSVRSIDKFINHSLQFVGGGVKAEEGPIVTTIQVPSAEMQTSSEKFFTSDRTTGEGGGLSDTQTMTKTSSSIMESSTMHSSMKKEYVTSTSSSTLSSCPVHHHPPPSNLCVKKTSHSSDYSSAYNGSAPLVQVSFFIIALVIT